MGTSKLTQYLLEFLKLITNNKKRDQHEDAFEMVSNSVINR